MPGSKYNSNSSRIPTRVERLLRERVLREQRKNIRASYTNDQINNHRGDRVAENGRFYREGDNSGVALLEHYLEEAAVARPFRQRLLVVANRLPVSAIRRGEDSWSLEISAGGLVSALLGVKEFEARWIGWAGVNVPDEIGQKALTKALAEKRCIPVFLDEEIVHQYYNGYCNNILWPLFHYLGLRKKIA
ncbi:hypothetical protein V6N11_052355 [Hibiscus sabdariffa]|uniref:Alpha,alpha-trehalose-phosphate synthase (UDP-forming) n=1 Tax=Hibiscus sabdariffa TaxID=183260 RepID=A0ABR2U9R2_9ROSI